MDKNPVTSDSVRSVLVITTGFVILYVWKQWAWTIYVAIVLGLAGVISHTLARWIHSRWMQLARMPGLIFPTLLLALIFFSVLTPLSWLYKLLKKDNQLHLKNSQPSQFISKAIPFTKESFEKPCR